MQVIYQKNWYYICVSFVFFSNGYISLRMISLLFICFDCSHMLQLFYSPFNRYKSNNYIYLISNNIMHNIHLIFAYKSDIIIVLQQLNIQGIAQLVEQRSPKPRVQSSSLCAPAIVVADCVSFATTFIWKSHRLTLAVAPPLPKKSSAFREPHQL